MNERDLRRSLPNATWRRGRPLNRVDGPKPGGYALYDRSRHGDLPIEARIDWDDGTTEWIGNVGLTGWTRDLVLVYLPHVEPPAVWLRASDVRRR